MDSARYKERLRHAFSFLEKAKSDETGPHDVKRAEALVAGIREEIQREVERLKDRNYAVARRQARLIEQLTAGRIKPEKANAVNRRLTVKAQTARASIADLNALLTAATSEQVGGFADLSPRKCVRGASGGWVWAGIQLKPTRLGFVIWLIAMAAAFAGALMYLGVFRPGEGVSLEVSTPDPVTGTVTGIGAMGFLGYKK